MWRSDREFRMDRRLVTITVRKYLTGCRQWSDPHSDQLGGTRYASPVCSDDGAAKPTRQPAPARLSPSRIAIRQERAVGLSDVVGTGGLTAMDYGRPLPGGLRADSGRHDQSGIDAAVDGAGSSGGANTVLRLRKHRGVPAAAVRTAPYAGGRALGTAAEGSITMIMPTQIHVTEDRRQALLAATPCAHQTANAARRARSSSPRPAGRVRAGLRHAIASLVALAFIV